jgi:hypothetical protein
MSKRKNRLQRETAIFNKAFRRWNPTSPLPTFQIHYYSYSAISHTLRVRGDIFKVRLSHLFECAPAAVIEAVANILFSRLYRHRTPSAFLNRYHLYVERSRPRFQRLLREARCVPAVHAPCGIHYDLDRLFERVNRAYFHPRLSKPHLRWSRNGALTKLGEYQALQHTIVINRRFDGEDIPPYVVEYLLYHEMLHMKHGAEIRQGRRVLHTPGFSEEEKRFKEFSEAKEWIRRLTQQPRWWVADVKI